MPSEGESWIVRNLPFASFTLFTLLPPHSLRSPTPKGVGYEGVGYQASRYHHRSRNVEWRKLWVLWREGPGLPAWHDVIERDPIQERPPGAQVIVRGHTGEVTELVIEVRLVVVAGEVG